MRTLVGVRYPSRMAIPSVATPRAASSARSPAPCASSPTTPSGSGRPPSAATLATAFAPPPQASRSPWNDRMSTGASRLIRFGVPVMNTSATRSTSIATGLPAISSTQWRSCSGVGRGWAWDISGGL